jgi:hypothetical protein
VGLGRQLATGGFGTVYKATLKEEDGSEMPVVVKKVCLRIVLEIVLKHCVFQIMLVLFQACFQSSSDNSVVDPT